MFDRRTCVAAALFVWISAAPASAAEPSPEEILKDFGLTKSASYFVIGKESQLFDVYHAKVNPAIQFMAGAFEKFAVVLRDESLLQEAEDERISLVDEVGNVDLTIPNLPQRNAAERQQVQALRQYRNTLTKRLTVVDNEIAVLKRRLPSQPEREKLQQKFEGKRSDFLQEAAGIRPIFDEIMGEYKRLKDEPKVKNALAAYKRLTKANLALGPSKRFTETIKAVKTAEKNYSPETAAPKTRKKNPTLKGKKKASPSRSKSQSDPLND